MPEGFDKLAGAIGDTLKTAPTLYEDALQPTTQESGEVLALIPRTIKAALLPLRQWIAEREYKLAETEKLLAKNLNMLAKKKLLRLKLMLRFQQSKLYLTLWIARNYEIFMLICLLKL